MALANSILVPGVYVTVDNSEANTALGEPFRTVIIGQKRSTGTATANTLTQVFSKYDALEKFGWKSMLSVMCNYWFDNTTVNEVYAIPLDDAGGSTKNLITVTFSGAATEDGNIYFYVNGNRYAASVASGDTAIDVALLVGQEFNKRGGINAIADALVGSNSVGFEAENGGTVGNQHDVRLNLGEGEELPAGIAASVIVDTAGATDPDIADAIAGLPDEVYNLIISPYTDAANLTALKTELDRRWGNTVQLDGHAIHAFKGTSSAVVTKGDALNSEHFTFMDSGKDTLVPSYLVAPSVGGRVANSASVDPARPFRTLPITGMIGDTKSNRRTFLEENSILTSGIGTHKVQPDSTVTIDRLVTTYKTNAVGAADTSYQNTNTMLNLSFMRQSFKTRMLSKYPRHKLADDGTEFGAGQPIATPSTIKGAIIDLYDEWIELGLAEDRDSFIDTLVVERDAVNRSRVNVTMQPILVGQLYQFDSTLQFIV